LDIVGRFRKSDRESAKMRKEGERRLAGSERVACGHAEPDDTSASVSRYRVFAIIFRAADHVVAKSMGVEHGQAFQGSTAEPSKFTVTPPVLGASIESKRRAARGCPQLSLRIIIVRRSIALFPESGALSMDTGYSQRGVSLPIRVGVR
jgi:hypothetical protein